MCEYKKRGFCTPPPENQQYQALRIADRERNLDETLK